MDAVRSYSYCCYALTRFVDGQYGRFFFRLGRSLVVPKLYIPHRAHRLLLLLVLLLASPPRTSSRFLCLVFLMGWTGLGFHLIGRALVGLDFKSICFYSIGLTFN